MGVALKHRCCDFAATVFYEFFIPSTVGHKLIVTAPLLKERCQIQPSDFRYINPKTISTPAKQSNPRTYNLLATSHCPLWVKSGLGVFTV
jgi:hypothetical protein